jgi:hypothetical protein
MFSLQIILPQKIQARRRIRIVLVLRRLLRLGLNVKLPLEADLLLVVHRQMQKLRQVLLLPFQVRVQQRHVPFASAPERVAFPAQFQRHFQRLLHLRPRKRKHVRVAARARPVHKARVREQIRRAPQQLHPRPLLLRLQHLHHRVQVLVRLGQRPPFRRNVPVVKTIIRRAQLRDELKGHPRPVLRVAHRVRAVVPRPLHRPRPEWIAPVGPERVPVRHRKTQVLPHRLARHDFVGVVVFERQRVL